MVFRQFSFCLEMEMMLSIFGFLLNVFCFLSPFVKSIHPQTMIRVIMTENKDIGIPAASTAISSNSLGAPSFSW